MPIIVRDGLERGRVGVAHWWPERDFCWGPSVLPTYMRRRARRMKSKYMTMVYVEFPNSAIATYAVCRANDQPSREKGRFIALLRMARLLKSMGLKMERQ